MYDVNFILVPPYVNERLFVWIRARLSLIIKYTCQHDEHELENAFPFHVRSDLNRKKNFPNLAAREVYHLNGGLYHVIKFFKGVGFWLCIEKVSN